MVRIIVPFSADEHDPADPGLVRRSREGRRHAAGRGGERERDDGRRPLGVTVRRVQELEVDLRSVAREERRREHRGQTGRHPAAQIRLQGQHRHRRTPHRAREEVEYR